MTGYFWESVNTSLFFIVSIGRIWSSLGFLRLMFQKSLCDLCISWWLEPRLLSFDSIFFDSLSFPQAALVAQMVKNPPAMQEVQSLGWEDALEKGMATTFSMLAWRIPWTEETGRLQPMGSTRVRHDWVTNAMTTRHSLTFCTAWDTLAGYRGYFPLCVCLKGTVLQWTTTKYPGQSIISFVHMCVCNMHARFLPALL